MSEQKPGPPHPRPMEEIEAELMQLRKQSEQINNRIEQLAKEMSAALRQKQSNNN